MSNPTNNGGAATAVSNGRRSTRVFQAVPLSVSGQNRIGNLFLESTSAVAVNCHGCLYPSRHEYRHGSWVTLEVPNQHVNLLARPVRAQVKFIRLPRSPQELYLVGVELENPANVWGITTAPEDWLRFADAPINTATHAPVNAVPLTLTPAPLAVLQIARGDEQHTLSVPSHEGGLVSTTTPSAPNEHAAEHTAPPAAGPTPANGASTNGAAAISSNTAGSVTPDQLLRLLDGKLQQAAEKAVSAALSARLNTAVNQAVKAIENFSQASLRQVEVHCSQYRETLVEAAREDLLERMNQDMAQAAESLRDQVAEFSSKTAETAQQLQNSAAQVQPLLAEAQGSLQAKARELQEQFPGQVRETVERAVAQFNEETERLSQRQLARLAEKAHAAGGEAARAIDGRAAEARTQLESAAGAILGEFHERAGIEINLALTESRKNIDASLAVVAAETFAAWDTRQRECKDELARSSEEQVADFRRRLTGIVNSSLVAAMTAVNSHSTALLKELVDK
jgi:hypothetical protein